VRVIQAAGITAMATAAAAGPLMVAALLDFNAETPVWAVSVLLIFGGAALVSRMLAGTGTFWPDKAWCTRTLTQLLPELPKAARHRRMLRRPGA
jgi:hypothetical protein